MNIQEILEPQMTEDERENKMNIQEIPEPQMTEEEFLYCLRLHKDADGNYQLD